MFVHGLLLHVSVTSSVESFKSRIHDNAIFFLMSFLPCTMQALQQLSRVCAVLVTEHMDESTVYLSHVLGWHSAKPLRHINRTPNKDPVDQLSHVLVSVANVADMGVYVEALQRVRLQREVLSGGSSASAESPRARNFTSAIVSEVNRSRTNPRSPSNS